MPPRAPQTARAPWLRRRRPSCCGRPPPGPSSGGPGPHGGVRGSHGANVPPPRPLGGRPLRSVGEVYLFSICHQIYSMLVTSSAYAVTGNALIDYISCGCTFESPWRWAPQRSPAPFDVTDAPTPLLLGVHSDLARRSEVQRAQ